MGWKGRKPTTGSVTEQLTARGGWSSILLRTAGTWGGTCLSGVLSKGRKLACLRVPESSVQMKSYTEAAHTHIHTTTTSWEEVNHYRGTHFSPGLGPTPAIAKFSWELRPPRSLVWRYWLWQLGGLQKVPVDRAPSRKWDVHHGDHESLTFSFLPLKKIPTQDGWFYFPEDQMGIALEGEMFQELLWTSGSRPSVWWFWPCH